MRTATKPGGAVMRKEDKEAWFIMGLAQPPTDQSAFKLGRWEMLGGRSAVVLGRVDLNNYYPFRLLANWPICIVREPAGNEASHP